MGHADRFAQHPGSRRRCGFLSRRNGSTIVQLRLAIRGPRELQSNGREIDHFSCRRTLPVHLPGWRIMSLNFGQSSTCRIHRHSCAPLPPGARGNCTPLRPGPTGGDAGLQSREFSQGPYCNSAFAGVAEIQITNAVEARSHFHVCLIGYVSLFAATTCCTLKCQASRHSRLASSDSKSDD